MVNFLEFFFHNTYLLNFDAHCLLACNRQQDTIRLASYKLKEVRMSQLHQWVFNSSKFCFTLL